MFEPFWRLICRELIASRLRLENLTDVLHEVVAGRWKIFPCADFEQQQNSYWNHRFEQVSGDFSTDLPTRIVGNMSGYAPPLLKCFVSG